MTTCNVYPLVKSDLQVMDNQSPKLPKIELPYTLIFTHPKQSTISTASNRGGFLPKLLDCQKLVDSSLVFDNQIELNTTPIEFSKDQEDFSFPLSDVLALA